MALLAIVCTLLECLVGKDGVLNEFIPDFALLHALQWVSGGGGVVLRALAGRGWCTMRRASPAPVLQSLHAGRRAQSQHPISSSLPPPPLPLQLILFMHGQLLPAWVLVVLRWGRQI